MQHLRILLNNIDFSEPSTWRGVILLVTSAGITLTPESMDVLVSIGLFLSGLVGLKKDK